MVPSHCFSYVLLFIDSLVNDKMQWMQELHKAERKLQELRQVVSSTQLEMSDLQNMDDPTPGDMRMLQEELELVNKKIRELESKVTATNTAMGSAASSLKNAETEMNDVEERIRSVTELLIPFQESLAHVHTDLQRARDDLAYYTKKKNEFESKVADAEQRREAAEKVADESALKASQICAEEIGTRRTPDSIASLIQQVEVEVDAERNRHGDPDELRQTLKSHKLRCVEVGDELQSLSNFVKRLSSMLKKRTAWFEEMRQHVAYVLQTYFSRCVSVQKNLTGKLRVSHADETIEPVIERNDDTDSGTHRSTLRGLSGGERSFVMTCFILALWHMIESPFSCLDEFDVYMDHVNRQQCLDMLLNVSSTESSDASRQFIILSPLSLAQWNLAKQNVNILHLAAPRKEQRYLPDLSLNQD